MYAVSPDAKFYTVKVLTDNEPYANFTMLSSEQGNAMRVYKSGLDNYFASENMTSYHSVAIFVYDGETLMTWNKFLYAHYVNPTHTQTMSWMVLLILIILLGITFTVAKEYMWATMILGSATVYVMGLMGIFVIDIDLSKIAGMLFGLSVVLYIITNLGK